MVFHVKLCQCLGGETIAFVTINVNYEKKKRKTRKKSTKSQSQSREREIRLIVNKLEKLSATENTRCRPNEIGKKTSPIRKSAYGHYPCMPIPAKN